MSTGELVVANLGDSHAILAERNPKTEDAFQVVSVTFSKFCFSSVSWKKQCDNVYVLATPHRISQTGRAE